MSSQVRKELRALFFGSGQAGEEQGEVPEALLLWLSQRYVSGADLQASLATLELRILRNVSLQLEQNRAQTLAQTQTLAQAQASTSTQTVTQSVQHTAAGEGLTEEVPDLHSLQLTIINFLSTVGRNEAIQCISFALTQSQASVEFTLGFFCFTCWGRFNDDEHLFSYA